ncbi:unnamed protein product [Pseudo-nitzschia multistriata]|uniref:CRAL-TRIO domain-containing protein n=1 Tax=Pseudo-nitzschia multistriata TaxID=183589 RepID=A0A448ZCC4_9STRA|nr:unnamed protein product [Pseudo-nitzschia multistriata]
MMLDRYDISRLEESLSMRARRRSDGGDDIDNSSNSNLSLSRGSDELSEMLCNQLTNMNFSERNAIQEEIHGARCMAVEETPALIRRSLNEFESELYNGDETGGSRHVYRRILKRHLERIEAASKDTSIVHPSNYAIDDEDFRLRFLRCEMFDASRAAQRFCNYLDLAYELFGDIVLERMVLIKDFEKSEINIFRKGYWQLMPFRDSSGRRVFVFFGGIGVHADLLLRDKILFYMWDVVTRDSVESQQKGFVIIRQFGNVGLNKNVLFNHSMKQRTNKIDFGEIANTMKRLFISIPSRIVALHATVPDNHIIRLLGKIILKRIFSGPLCNVGPRFVLGSESSDTKALNRLKSYGIPVDLLPSTETTNSIKSTFHNQWMKTRSMVECGYIEHSEEGRTGDRDDRDENREKINGTFVECPGLNDVVFRKGSRLASLQNPGNRLFRDLIGTVLEEKENRLEKQRKQTATSAQDTTQIDASTSSSENDDGEHANPSSARQYAASTVCNELSCNETTFLPSALESANTGTSKSKPWSGKHTERGFCDWLVNHIIHNLKGRFLDWEPRMNGWVVMTDKIKIRRKVSVSLYNWGKKLKTQAKHQSQGLLLSKNKTAHTTPFCNGKRDATIETPPFGREHEGCDNGMSS